MDGPKRPFVDVWSVASQLSQCRLSGKGLLRREALWFLVAFLAGQMNVVQVQLIERMHVHVGELAVRVIKD